MPIHDWTRVDAGLFHSFHLGWTVGLSGALNTGGLPASYFALVEKKPRGPLWTYKYKHGTGWKIAKATAEDIIHWYEDGILPNDFFVAPVGKKTHQHFRTIPEFHAIQRRKAPAAPQPIATHLLFAGLRHFARQALHEAQIAANLAG